MGNDFFFVLSGFVIGYAYDDRWDRMTVRSFFKRRLVRLHPMVILGTVFGALLFYLQEGETFPLFYIHQSWAVRYADAPLGRHIFFSVCIFVLAILVAYASYRFYDLPVREWLKNRWFKVASRS